jgi:hypothetical protein
LSAVVALPAAFCLLAPALAVVTARRRHRQSG